MRLKSKTCKFLRSTRTGLCLGLFLVLFAGTRGTQYGKFNMLISDMITCKGPKLRDCAKSEVVVHDKRYISVKVDLSENMKLTSSKIVVITNGKPFLRLQMNDPCNHIFLKPLMKSFFNITDSCMIYKKLYIYTVDLQKIAEDYFAKEFVFGNYTFKSTFYNSNCNLFCSKLDTNIIPKN